MEVPISAPYPTRSRWFATIASAALLTYVVLIALPGLTLGTLVLRTRHAAALLVASCAALAWLTGRLAARQRGGVRLNNLGAASLSILVSLLAADMVFAFWRNMRAGESRVVNVTYQRESDAVIWHGELYPRIYYPTKLGFQLYKPNVTVQGTTYGEYYEHRMLASPLLRDSVLQARQVGYHINRHGLRESGALSAARIFALGDSYVFGFATDETAIWPKVLERTIGQPVYNLGVSDSGPRQQVQLLEHLLRLHADSMHVEHLLWMIFEGNDLENSYQELRSAASTARQADGSFALALTGLPRLLREHSVIHALLIGGLTVRRGHDATKEVEGVVLRNPLYHSVRWGYRLFNPYDIQTVRRGAQYVQSHPNAPALAATVREMTKLSEKMGFRVTVILAPTDARLYGRSFEGMPALSETPYFLDHFGSLAAQSGFSVVDLSRLMASYAERELLYYRDDHHWNARGNAIAAQLIAQSIEF